MTHDTPPSGTIATLTVAEITAIAREWVTLHARTLPSFAGAYLRGGVTALPPDAAFPLYRDVDVALVLTDGAPETEEEFFYRGLMLEVSSYNLAEHRDAEAVLADPSRGPNIATTTILADPTGALAPFQRVVAADYGRRRWVQARCDVEKESATKQLEAMRQIPREQEGLWAVWGLLSALSGLMAVAQLARPTTRRTLALLGDLLDAQGRRDLREAALAVWGSAHMQRDEVQTLLEQSAAVFDRSVAVYRTPTSFGFTIRDHLRPYLVAATQEMIDAGDHREAVFWIVTLVTEAYLVLQNDAPEAERPAYAAQLRALLDGLGYTSAEAWAARVAEAERLATEVFAIADALTAQHPE